MKTCLEMDFKNITSGIFFRRTTPMPVFLICFIIHTGIPAGFPTSAVLLHSPGEPVEVKITELMFNDSQTRNYTSPPFCPTVKGNDREITFQFHDKPDKQVRLVTPMYDIRMGDTVQCSVLCGGNNTNQPFYLDWTAEQGRTVATLIREDFRFKMTVGNVPCKFGVRGLGDKTDHGLPLGFCGQAEENASFLHSRDACMLSKSRPYLYNHLSFHLEYAPENDHGHLRKVTECSVYPHTFPWSEYDSYGPDPVPNSWPRMCIFQDITSRDVYTVGYRQPVEEHDTTTVVFSYSVEWTRKKPDVWRKKEKMLQKPRSKELLDSTSNSTGESNPEHLRLPQKPDQVFPWKSTVITVAVLIAVTGTACVAVGWKRRQHIAKYIRHHTELVVGDANIPLEAGIPEEETFGYSCQYEFTHTEILGRGRYGTVYKATMKADPSISAQHYAAVKVTHCNAGESMVLTEAENWRLQHLVLLRHAHLVAYHKITITRKPTGATVELLMDYCNGGDLSCALRKQRGTGELLLETVAVRYATEITRGLEFLHRNKILHGDLKPENILVNKCGTDEERLLIGDLDDLIQLWRTTTTSQDVKHLRGTVRYMSPEMLRKFAVDPTESVGRKTDIWSLGCIMIDLSCHITGVYEKWLVSSEDRVQIGEQMPQHRLATLVLDGYSHLVPDSPARLSAITRQCLRVGREARLSAEDVLQLLLVSAAELNN